MRYFIVTYGCQMNRSDSERIAAVLENKGYKPVKNASQADLVVVNICSVRQKAIDKVKEQITRLCAPKSRLKSGRRRALPKIILTGCVLDTDKKFFEKLGIEIKQFKKLEKINPKIGFVPIMRGCNNFCSYCVVPYTRGREEYRSQKEIVCEVEHLIKKDIKEITLLGQNVNSYPNFVRLLQKITALPGNFKIKFITNHPKDFSHQLIDEIAQNHKIAKHIHLPIQSGDNRVLKKMKRNYTREQYLALVKKIRIKIPEVEISTDVIVGFPGETKKQFQNTVTLFKKIKFVHAYISKYSPRQGTVAFKLKDNVTLKEKKRREQVLRKLLLSHSHSEGERSELEESRDPSGLPQDDNKRVVIILGPTAVGKTELSIKIAKKFNGEIVSADSRQIYKGMNIGTGKVTKKEMQGIPHYLLDVVSPKTKFSVAKYQKKAIGAINKILKKKKTVFLVGGSPFYIYSVVEGWQFPKMKANLKLRKVLENRSIDELFKMLKKLAPNRAKTIEPKNKRRLIRAIEIAKTLGKVPILKKNPEFDCLIIGIQSSKDELEKKISTRVDKMIKQGLEKEVKKLPKTETIGYQEWYDYFEGKMKKDEVVEKIKSNTLAFAKRQMTWFKKDPNIHWVKSSQQAENLVKEFLR